MKKREQSLSQDFKPMKLYYEDLEELYDIFKEHSGEVKVDADTYELDSIEEILKIKKDNFTDLKIYAHNPYISLDFSKNAIRLYISDDTPFQRGLFEKLKRLLKQKERYFISSLFSYYAYVLFLVVMSTLSFWENSYITYTVGILAVSLYIIQGIYTFKWHSIIIPIHKSSKPSFFQRNKDQMITSIISAVIGGAIVLYLTKLLDK